MTPEEYINAGYRLLDEGETEKARASFLQAHENNSMVATAILGLMAYDDQDYSTCRKYLEEATQRYEALVPNQEELDYAGLAYFCLGEIFFFGLGGEKMPQLAAPYYVLSLVECNCERAREMAGLMYFQGHFEPDEGKSGKEEAMEIWAEGMEKGDKRCILRWCITKVEDKEADESVIDKLKALATDPEEPESDACAVLYTYYSWEGDEDEAWKWREKGIEMESNLMQSIVDDEKEEEVGEDDWHPHTDMSMFFAPDEDDDDDDEFDGYDDETEASHPGYPEVGEKYVIIAAVDDSFRIVQADAADWRSLPPLIGAERCDDMRCQKFRDVAHKLMLPGTLLGQLDKDAFRKHYLKPNWHASQWYDGTADLMGAMVICMEDQKYNPFSFTSKAQAQSVIDALCKQ